MMWCGAAALTPEHLIGDKGLVAILKHFPKLKWKGRGSEAADMHQLVKSYREWAFELNPRLNFQYIARRLAVLGQHKRLRVRLA